MRLIECEAGSWVRSPGWTENAVAEVVAEVDMQGLVRILVHTNPPGQRPSARRSRFATVEEMERENWESCDRPGWAPVPCGSGGGFGPR
jgi:hypothetical protein